MSLRLTSRQRIVALAGALLAGSGVVFGAFGAHALRARLDAEGLGAWETAVLYQLVHGLALLATAALAPLAPRGYWLDRAALALALGTLLFSGSIYWLSLGGPGWLGPVTPIGGVLLILGWLGAVLALTGGRVPRRE